ncbi:CAP-associated domain-containing protein, partial [Liquorilactobacillus ghanensis]
MKKKFYWKSVFNFLWILLLILGIFYVNTALKDQQNGSKSKKVTTIEKKQDDNNIKLTTPKVKALKTSKMAAYIGVSSSVILTDFGQPTATVASASNLKWWLYNLNNQSYLKIGIDQY